MARTSVSSSAPDRRWNTCVRRPGARSSLYHAVLRELPGDSVRQSEIFHAFVNALTAHLALNNMLAVVNDPDARERLLRMSREGFEEWLDRVDRGGSVCG